VFQKVGQFGNPLQVLYVIVTQYSWIFGFFAVVSWIVAQQIMRKISTLVAYHKKGNVAEIYGATEKGSLVEFLPKKGVLFARRDPLDIVTAKIEAEPEIQVTGLRTFRVHHIIEGYNKSVNVRQIPRLIAEMFLLRTGAMMGGEGTSVSTSLATMQQAFTTMGQSFPKTRAEYFTNLVYATAGLGWGIVIGYFIFKPG